MSQNAPQASPQATNTLIWLALTFAPTLYVFIAFVLRPGTAPALTAPDFSNALELGLTIAALAAAFAGFFAPRAVAAGIRRARGDSWSPTDDDMARAAQIPLVIQYALFESIAVYGFVMVLAGGPASRIIPFAAVSFALLMLHRPTPERVSGLFAD